MSKAVRIRENLYAEVARLAKEERRSILAQLEVLLEQALALREIGEVLKETDPSLANPHFKPDPK